jgi:hypothetical protein
MTDLLRKTTIHAHKNKTPKQASQYKPKGRKNVGRPRKTWRNQFHFEDQETGNIPNPS